METSQLYVIGCVFLLAAVDNCWACKRMFSGESKSIIESAKKTEVDSQIERDSRAYSCGVCLDPIDVHFIVRNHYQKPYFEYSVSVIGHPQRELIYHLERAADMNPHFKFSTEYTGSLGYYLSAINGLKGQTSDKTYWKLVDHPTGEGLSLGLSMHIPAHNQTILFDFTTWDTTYVG